jgi:hypothetical protein
VLAAVIALALDAGPAAASGNHWTGWWGNHGGYAQQMAGWQHDPPGYAQGVEKIFRVYWRGRTKFGNATRWQLSSIRLYGACNAPSPGQAFGPTGWRSNQEYTTDGSANGHYDTSYYAKRPSIRHQYNIDFQGTVSASMNRWWVDGSTFGFC